MPDNCFTAPLRSCGSPGPSSGRNIQRIGIYQRHRLAEDLPGRFYTPFSFFIETQFNPSHNPDENFEFGVTPGLQYRYPFTEKLSGYLLVSAGPHYMSLVTREQENGFIFSDTIGGGLYYFLKENFALNLGYRFRHMSNSGLAKPNDGINTNFITFGYAAFF